MRATVAIPFVVGGVLACVACSSTTKVATEPEADAGAVGDASVAETGALDDSGSADSGPADAGTDAATLDGGVDGASAAESLYRALESDLVSACGGGCHGTAATSATAPTFLAGPDTYKTIVAYPGIVVPSDPNKSILLTKGMHEGPSIFIVVGDGGTTTLGVRVEAWLHEEAAAH